MCVCVFIFVLCFYFTLFLKRKFIGYGLFLSLSSIICSSLPSGMLLNPFLETSVLWWKTVTKMITVKRWIERCWWWPRIEENRGHWEREKKILEIRCFVASRMSLDPSTNVMRGSGLVCRASSTWLFSRKRDPDSLPPYLKLWIIGCQSMLSLLGLLAKIKV